MLIGQGALLPHEAQAKKGSSTHSAVKKGGHGHKSKSRKVARRGKRGGRGKFSGRLAQVTELRSEPLPTPSGRVVLRSDNLREEVDVNIYNEDGSFNQDALARLDHVFRCRRTNEERAVDPRLFEILSIIHDKFGKTIVLNSGFRYQRNEGSRHFHASAMDVVVPGVGMDQLYSFAQTLDLGGMGIGRYPYGGFVHIDYRAPGEASYRWTDTHRAGSSDPGKQPSKMWKRTQRPNT